MSNMSRKSPTNRISTPLSKLHARRRQREFFLPAGGPNQDAALSQRARSFGYDLLVIDVGVETDTSAAPLPGVQYRRVSAGTRNFLTGPAMSLKEVTSAIEVGVEATHEAVAHGATLLGIGEMGIG